MKTPTCTPECIPELGAHSATCLESAGIPRAGAIPVESDGTVDFEKIPNILDSTEVSELVEADETVKPQFTCKICGEPIGQFRIQVGNWDLCIKCGDCTECGHQVTISEIAWCIKYNEPVAHAKCRVRKAIPVSIQVDQDAELLNNARLCVYPDVSMSVETNILIARTAEQKLWETMSMEEKFIHTQMMEAVYSFAYSALKKDPKELAILKAEKLQKAAKDNEIERTKDIKKQRESLPSEKKKMNAQEQFLAGMLKSGVVKEMAIQIWKSQGKTWVE